MNREHSTLQHGTVGMTRLLLAVVLFAAQNLPAVVASYGDNLYGQAPPGGGSPVGSLAARAMCAGYWHNVIVKSGGDIGAWGLNSYGQTNVPAALTSVPGSAIAVAAGHDHSLALYSTRGLVIGWGDNTYGQIAVPPDLSDVSAIAAGAFHSAALLSNGTVVCWGYNAYGQTNVPATLTNATAVACGGAFTLALRSDGTVVGWGDNFYGQTDVPADLTNVVAIAAGFAHCLAVQNDGTVVGWGDVSLGQDTPPVDLTDVIAVAAGFAHSLALKRNGTVVSWGSNASGQRNYPSKLDRVLAVSAGYGHSAFLIDERPWIKTQPQSVTTNAGATVAFTVSASGASSTLVYYWKFNGTNVSTSVSAGNSTNSLVLFNVTTNRVGDYWVVVSNIYGGTTSRVVSLNVAGASGVISPAIATNPASQTINASGYAIFSVAAVGTAPLSYQWRFCASNSVVTNLAAIELPAATNSFLYLTNARPEDGGGYSVVVSNAGGAVTSQVATLVVRSPPTIISEPTDIATNLYASVAFSVGAKGTSPLTYLWWFNGSPLGAGWNTHTLAAVTTNNVGSYHVVVTNLAGAVTSRVATLTLLGGAAPDPLILTNPVNQIVNRGTNVTFSVVASGAEPLSYQWRFQQSNGFITNFVASVDLPGATNSSYTVESAEALDVGGYSVVVSNAYGSVSSGGAALIVRAPPVMLTEPVDTAAAAGTIAGFQVYVAGAGPLTYQWWFSDGTNLTKVGNSRPWLTLSGVTLAHGGDYFVSVTNAFGSTASRTAKLTVTNDISLTPAKLFATAHAGSSAVYLTIAFEAGKNYRIQGSTNMGDWVDLTNLLSTAATMDFLDLVATNTGQMFYRVVSP